MKKSANTAQAAEQRQLVWHKLNSSRGEGVFKLGDVYRTKVPAGWLVLVVNNASGLTFYPDPEHNWDGGSLTA